MVPSNSIVPILPAFSTGGHGVALSAAQETEAFAASRETSDDGLAAVVLGPLRRRAPAERVDEITFPASANGQRILLRGWLVQFGGSKVTVCQAKYQITAEDNGVAVVACEARREYIHDWVDFTTNPMRYLHTHIEKLQSAISSWSKRWYKDNKQAQADRGAYLARFRQTAMRCVDKCVDAVRKSRPVPCAKKCRCGCHRLFRQAAKN